MNFGFDEHEKELLRSLASGLSRIEIYKTGLYPSAVSLVSSDDQVVTLRARSEDVADRFEVFPMVVSAIRLGGEPAVVWEGERRMPTAISILQKSEWQEPCAEENKAHLLGEATEAMTQFEGRPRGVPPEDDTTVTLHAGVMLSFDDGSSFASATSMFPFALYVRGCSFSEDFDAANYDKLDL